MNSPYAVELNSITKSFGDGFKANDSVTLQVKKGEIHALVGENGAGKTTLMKVLYGMYKPDSGTIRIHGKEIQINSPAEAISLGIGMVHQHFMLVDTLTVLENIVLGDEGTFFLGPVNYKMAASKISEILRNFDINIDLQTETGKLPVGTQQKIEIVKLLYRNADILILDEPTAVLTPQETEDLFSTLKELASDGKTVILITHKLGEVMDISTAVTVLRKGRVTGVVETASTDKTSLAGMIIGEEMEQAALKENIAPGRKILNVENLSVENDKGSAAVNNVSFTITEGEILGIAGVEGNGQNELVEAINAMRSYSLGSIKIDGKEINSEMPIAHIPADRHKHGIVMEYNLAENLLLGRENESRFSTPFNLNYTAAEKYTEKLIQSYDIRPGTVSSTMGGLSGGNQQKLVAARELTKDTRLIIACHPTRGLDIKAANFVQNTLLTERNKGRAVILVSSDLTELMNLSTRIAVMYNGRIAVILEPSKINEHEIGTYMMGLKSN
jgi:simple sugar transport system ATP-binding protein